MPPSHPRNGGPMTRQIKEFMAEGMTERTSGTRHEETNKKKVLFGFSGLKTRERTQFPLHLGYL